MKITKILTACLLTAAILASATSCSLMTRSDETKSGIVVLPTEGTTEQTEQTSAAQTSDKQEESTVETEDTTPFDPPYELLPDTGSYINPLTGKAVENDPSGIRPLAVVVDNCGGAMAHQSGVAEADVLIETLVAPGITRFLAVYSDYRSVQQICNVRGGRASDAKLSALFNAVLVCHSGHSDMTPEYDFLTAVTESFGSETAYINTKAEPAWSAQNGSVFGTVRYYDAGYRTDLKYDTVVTPDAIKYTESQKRYSPFASSGGSLSGDAVKVFGFTDAAPSGDNATNISITFTASGVYSPLEKRVAFKYSAESGKYLRFQDSIPHVDSASGVQLSFDNVIVLGTDVKYIAGDEDADPLSVSVSVYGSGTGYYLSGGKCTSVVWVCSADGGLVIYEPGGVLSLSEGNTYLAFTDRANPAAISIK